MNKAELIEKLAEKSKACSKAEAGRSLEALLEIITETLKKGEEVVIAGFGTFQVKEKKARMGINPKTKEKIQIPAKKVPRFKPGKGLKDALK